MEDKKRHWECSKGDCKKIAEKACSHCDVTFCKKHYPYEKHGCSALQDFEEEEDIG